MKTVPIIKKCLRLEEAVPGNFKIKLKPYYVKVFSELYDREEDFSLGFIDKKKGVKEAEYVARKYQDLVDEGFYPPKTQFIVARDELDVITIISIMPKIKSGKRYQNLKKEISRLRDKAAKVLGIKKDVLWSDTKKDENYGLLEGKLYCWDLHVLDFNKILKNGNKYRAMPWS